MSDAKKRATRSARNPKKKYWSGDVTRKSNALDLEPGVFTWNDPQSIAVSLARSARQSTRRKGTASQSAMSMLNFYINRAGINLGAERKRTLERARDELRAIFEKG